MQAGGLLLSRSTLAYRVRLMSSKILEPKARLVLLLNALYMTADALCSVFVAVYLWKSGQRFEVVCYHYLAIFAVTPFVFLLAGWYSQARDRVHMYRLGLFFHAVYYAAILYLQERSVAYAAPLGALLGMTWGFFWAGNNVFHYDATNRDNREYFFGWLTAVSSTARFVAPAIAGWLIEWLPDNRFGYHVIFFLAMCIFLAAMVLSWWMPHDRTRRPFHIRRALFPGPEHRDWRLIMAAALSIAGAFQLFHVLLGLIMYMQTSREGDVGLFASGQALVSIIVAYFAGRLIVPRNRKRAMFLGTLALIAGGVLVLVEINLYTLIAFGFLRSVATPLFQIPHLSVRFQVIDQSVEDPSQRIEYIAAWEVPLAMGRMIMLGLLVTLYLMIGEWGLRITLFLLCLNRVATYFLVSRTSVIREQEALEVTGP
jgi:MFS transporter, YQGE family, putative transporter